MDKAKLHEIADIIQKQRSVISTEEATKMAFVMPFIKALGYDVFNPAEVIPEFVADVGSKKGEKVDYAIKRDDKIIMLFECKNHVSVLRNEHASQLRRYFHVTEAEFGVLTNGIQYYFYAGLDKQNVMDDKPFFEFDMLSIESQQFEHLEKFAKASFAKDEILRTANALKYIRAIKNTLAAEMENPSQGFVHFMTKQVYDGKITSSVGEQFKELTAKAMQELIRDRVNARLETAKIQSESPQISSEPAVTVSESDAAQKASPSPEEQEAFMVIRAIARAACNPNRIAIRDAASYCAILFDDNNRKPLVRLYFNNPTRMRLGIFSEKQEQMHDVSDLSDIYSHSEKILAEIGRYLTAGNVVDAKEESANVA